MKKIAKIIFPFVFVLFSLVAFAQEIEDEKISDIEQRMPEFPGGMDSLGKFLNTNIVYPDSALKYKREGRVIISFVVEKDGSISEICSVNEMDAELISEAIRVVKLMPNWKPGIQNGEKVRVKFSLPIRFKAN